MKAITAFILTLSFFLTVGAQPNPDTLWTRTYGGYWDDAAHSVRQTADGGYILAGWTRSFGVGSGDFYLVKTNSEGDTLWTRTYGGIGDDIAQSVQQTADGDYIVAGYTESFGAGSADFYLVKTNSQGDTLWTRTYGGSGTDWAHSVQQTADGGYIVAGLTHSFGVGNTDFYLVKTNGSGDTLWTRTYGGYDDDWAFSIQQTTDGGYIIAGLTYSFGEGGDFYLVKTNSQGDTLWTRTYGGSDHERAFSIQQTTDGGYVVVGDTFAGWYDFYLVKTDSLGDTMWTHTYGGDYDDRAYSVQQTADGGYIVAGETDSFGVADRDFYLVKTNSRGNTLWTRTYGGNGIDWAGSVQQTTDGGYVVAGHTTSFGAGNGDFYLVKTGPEPTEADERLILHPSSFVLSCFPNPFNASAQITYVLPKAEHAKLSIFNLLGEQVATLADGVQSAGSHAVSFDGTGLASGVYLYRLQAEGFMQTRKMVVLK